MRLGTRDSTLGNAIIVLTGLLTHVNIGTQMTLIELMNTEKFNATPPRLQRGVSGSAFATLVDFRSHLFPNRTRLRGFISPFG